MGRTFASADWHGCGSAARKVFEYLQPDDKLYFLGDAIDRGYDGYEIMVDLLTDNRVTYIRGNHEQLMANAIPNILNGYRQGASSWLDMNGGEATWGCIETLTDTQLMGLVRVIGTKMSSVAIYENKNGQKIILEHAGYSPFDRYASHRRHDPFWDRDHFYDVWCDHDNSEAERTYIVHGHTPVQYLDFHYGYKGQPKLTKERMKLQRKWNLGEDMGDYVPSIIRYCDGHKFDIDMCTIVSHRVALLDLDTFEEIYFDCEPYWWEVIE